MVSILKIYIYKGQNTIYVTCFFVILGRNHREHHLLIKQPLKIPHGYGTIAVNFHHHYQNHTY